MKSRSHHHRLQSAADDWVDESWTVDCVCGVNFDDGEEMVNCDECGVWVHTRCSRYVKGDDVFACHKCKTKNNRSITTTTITSNEAQEETEVAQFLVELPTKTVIMDTSLASNANVTATANNHNPTCRRPFRLWTDLPMDERVHVQGIPGGDPSLFHGLSNVFTPQLWKSAGYIPKSIKIQYREFPCWDNVEKGFQLKGDNEKKHDNKKADLSTNSLRIGDGQLGFDSKTSSTKMIKCESNCTVGIRPSQICMKQESSYLHPGTVQSTKRTKEDLWTCKDRSGKNSGKSVDRDTDGRRGPLASVSVFTPTSDAKQLEFCEDRGLLIFKANSRSMKNRSSRETGAQSYVGDHSFATEPNMQEANRNVITVGESSEALCLDMLRVCSVGRAAKQDQTSLKGQSLVEESSKTVNVVMSLDGCGSENALANMEREDGPEINVAGDNAIATRFESSPPLDLPTVSELHNHIMQVCNGVKSSSTLQPFIKLKGKDTDDNNKRQQLFHSSSDINNERICIDPVLDPSKNSVVALSMPVSGDNRICYRQVGPVIRCDLRTVDANGSSGDAFHIKQETEGLTNYGEIKYAVGSAAEQSKSDSIVLTSVALLKMDSKSPYDYFKNEDAQAPDNNLKSRSISEVSVPVTKDSQPLPTSERARDDEKHNFHKMVKEHENNLSKSTSKAPYSGRSSQESSKQVDPNLKISWLNSSSKAFFSQNISTNSSGEAHETICHPKALFGQNKMSASGLVLRGEKLNHSNIQPFAKTNQNIAGSVLPSTGSSAHAMLSDEELALLLHQELNSSPRVPRVPRVRHASSLPQLPSPNGSGLLIKRTPNSGGKDHIMVSRRKHKDASKDEVWKPHEDEDNSKKLDKLLSSPNQRKQDIEYREDCSVKEEDHGSSTAHSVSMNLSFVSTSTANSGLSSSPENPSLSSVRESSRITLDGDSVRMVVHLTLPGLINEIMSKGRRMTYEELCNAVLPHWHNLRKHNGERYAYSSHSQAVLDCLRNRQEWARLVDRGPKNNLNRKRCKHEAEESDDNEWSKSRWAKVDDMSLECPKEEFPKGKRNARKRRRLALQGRAVKDVRKRPKAFSSDEDAGPFSDSSEGSMFSDDETQAGGACPVGSNASVSSDEVGTSN